MAAGTSSYLTMQTELLAGTDSRDRQELGQRLARHEPA